jgi:hypothetical protein
MIRSEAVANSNGGNLALAPEDRRVPITLVRAASLDADFGDCEYRTSFGDHLKVRFFDKIHIHSADAVAPDGIFTFSTPDHPDGLVAPINSARR